MTESLKKVHKSYHPRENGSFKEVTEKYLNRIEEFEEHLVRSRIGLERKREVKRKSYLKNREKTLKRTKEWKAKRKKGERMTDL